MPVRFIITHAASSAGVEGWTQSMDQSELARLRISKALSAPRCSKSVTAQLGLGIRQPHAKKWNAAPAWFEDWCETL